VKSSFQVNDVVIIVFVLDFLLYYIDNVNMGIFNYRYYYV